MPNEGLYKENVEPLLSILATCIHNFKKNHTFGPKNLHYVIEMQIKNQFREFLPWYYLWEKNVKNK